MIVYSATRYTDEVRRQKERAGCDIMEGKKGCKGGRGIIKQKADLFSEFCFETVGAESIVFVGVVRLFLASHLVGFRRLLFLRWPQEEF